MTLRVPTAKIAAVGMRKLAEPPLVKRALETLKGRARIKRTMWSRRAQEYEAKINSGDIVAIAEVVRDLYRSESQPEQSYSERQLYEAALDRLAARAKAADEAGDEKTILFNLSGHGHFDMAAYDNFFAGKLEDVALDEGEIQRALKAIEGLPQPA